MKLNYFYLMHNMYPVVFMDMRRSALVLSNPRTRDPWSPSLFVHWILMEELRALSTQQLMTSCKLQSKYFYCLLLFDF